MIIQTERLLLRPWQQEDFQPFSELNADPRVMEYFPSVLTASESDLLAEKFSSLIEKNGWGFWAVSVPSVANFIGFIGLSPVNFASHFTPVIEIGWRLAYPFWNKGYATEGAQASLQYGFETLALNEIVSFTAVENHRSRRVMERIGMHRNPEDDFDHPKLSAGDPLQRHVLYRLKKEEWKDAILASKSNDL